MCFRAQAMVNLAVTASCLASAYVASAGAAGSQCTAPTLAGCFVDPFTIPDGTNRSVLAHTAASGDASMTLNKCVQLCCTAGYGAGSLAGVERGVDCHCDHSFGPYTVPTAPAAECGIKCPGDATETCGGTHRIQTYKIATCPGEAPALPWTPWTPPQATPPAALQQCGAGGCTSCPAEDTCCLGVAPDAYKVAGGYGCSPPDPTPGLLPPGCAGGGRFANNTRCCCGPGPSVVSHARAVTPTASKQC
jgi:hypothetical protein